MTHANETDDQPKSSGTPAEPPELTFKQRQMVASGRGTEVAVTLLGRSSLRHYVSLAGAVVCTFFAIRSLVTEEPVIDALWWRVGCTVAFGAGAILYWRGVRRARSERCYARAILQQTSADTSP